jgi:2-iminobutanoate/2-iminopropanoate deaminase
VLGKVSPVVNTLRLKHIEMKKIISIQGAPAPVGPYSQAVLVNDILFVSGQIPLDPMTGQIVSGDIRQQTKQVMDNIGALLKEAGMGFPDVIKASIFLADMNNFVVVNETYASYFTSDFPARETIQAARLPKDAQVEISVMAMKGNE